MTEDFILRDGTRATVHWVNGPPYLTVSYKKSLRQCSTELTLGERAYRRGCFQVMVFLKRFLVEGYTPASHPAGRSTYMDGVAVFEQALVAGCDSLDPAYLGKYLDTVLAKAKEVV